ncbi:MAG TPA: hypothetical protein VNJ08_06910 [Bacteriovoracaceae bacterium]|nr:hypothetical protein [Bacteriovoracaceae bacterium]
MKKVIGLVLFSALSFSAFAQHGGGHGGGHGGYQGGGHGGYQGGGHGGYQGGGHGGYQGGGHGGYQGGGHGGYTPVPHYPTVCRVDLVDHHNTTIQHFTGYSSYYTNGCSTALEQCYNEIHHRDLHDYRCVQH